MLLVVITVVVATGLAVTAPSFFAKDPAIRVGAIGAGAAVLALFGLLVLRSQRSFTHGDSWLDAVALDLAAKAGPRSRDQRLALLDGKPAAIEIPFQVDGRAGQRTNVLEIHFDTVKQFYTSQQPQRVMITGAPGAGKTVQALQLVEELVTKGRQERRIDHVPIWLSLAGWDTARAAPRRMDWEMKRVAWEQAAPFEILLVEHLVREYQSTWAEAVGLVHERRILPVIDGLDELDTEPGSTRRARQALTLLNSYWSSTTVDTPIIVTCRDDTYDQLLNYGPPLHDSVRVQLQPVTAAQSAAYLRERVDADRWRKVLDDLSKHPAGRLARGLATPWRLAQAVAVYEDYKLDPSELRGFTGPELEERLLSQYITAAMRQHPCIGRKILDPEEVTAWLRVIADHLKWQGSQNMSGTRIVLHQWWPVAGVNKSRISHIVTALVAYFLGLAAVAVVVLGPIFSAFSGTIRSAAAILRHTHTLTLGLLIFSIVMVIIAPLLVVFKAAGYWPKPSHRVYFRQLITIRGLVQLALCAALGYAVGYVAGALIGPWVGAKAGRVIVSMVGLAYGLTIGLRRRPVHGLYGALRPPDIVRNDLWYGAVCGVVAAVCFTLAGTITYGMQVLKAYLVAGVMAGVFSYGLSLNAVVALRYYLTCALAAAPWRASRRLPPRFTAFLRWACTAGLLRESGIAYEFRHIELQKWLTSPALPNPGSIPVPDPLFGVDGGLPPHSSRGVGSTGSKAPKVKIPLTRRLGDPVFLGSAFTAVVIAICIVVGTGIHFSSPPYSAKNVGAPLNRAAAPSNQNSYGQLSLDKYCPSGLSFLPGDTPNRSMLNRKFKGPNIIWKWSCSYHGPYLTQKDFDSACQKEHPGARKAVSDDPNNAYSWSCY